MKKYFSKNPAEILPQMLESYELLENMGEIGNIGAWKVEVEHQSVLWTRVLYDIYEMDSPTPLSFQEILSLDLPSYRSLHEQAVMELMVFGKPFDIEVETLTTKGNHRWLRIIGKPLYAEGRITHRIGITQDITKQKALEFSAMENSKKYQTLFEAVSDAILLVDDETLRIVEVNDAALTLYGFPRDKILSLKITDFSAEPQATIETLKTRRPFVPLRWHKKNDGTLIPVELKINSIFLKDRIIHLIVSRDISSRIESERNILSLLKEKEILLKEVHHRIKNHMQTAIGLLDLQGASTEDTLVLEQIQDAKNRLKSLSFLYDKMYRKENLENLSLQDYIPNLVQEIIKTYPKKVLIELEMDIPPIFIELKQLYTLGILVNELITNSLKHAFPDRSKGKIQIQILKTSSHLTIHIQDDGIGIPQSSMDTDKGLGLKLVRSLTKQLRGTIHFYTELGTKIKIELPVSL